MIHTYLTRKWSTWHHTWKCFAVTILLAATSLSCKKQKVYEGNPAVLQVFNALEDGDYLFGNLTGTHPIRYASAVQIGNPNWARINITSASQPVAFYAFNDTLPESKPVWSQTLELVPGKMYSLFIIGEKKNAGHVLVENHYLPYRANDTVTNVRFANMYRGQPVSINLKGNPAGSLVSTVAYKEVTSFSVLKFSNGAPEMEFEFRNTATGELLGTYRTEALGSFEYGNGYWNLSWTLVATAQPGGTGAGTLRFKKVENR